MTLDTFIALAASTDANVYYREATPWGGWSNLKPIADALEAAEQFCRDEGTATNDDDLAFALTEVLETAIVVAVARLSDSCVGAWNESGWFLGTAGYTTDAAAEQLYRCA